MPVSPTFLVAKYETLCYQLQAKLNQQERERREQQRAEELRKNELERKKASAI